MKKTKLIFKTMLLLVLSTAIISCDDDDPVTPAVPTATAFVVANPNFSSLEAALVRADLASTLNGAGPFTIFAPTNDAFNDFLTANNFADLNAVPVDVLRNTLLNHVVSGTVRSTDLTSGYIKTSATNNGMTTGDALDMYVNIRSGVVLNGVATVTGADNMVSNGIIHVVNQVIALPTVVTLAAANPDFSNLVTAVTQANLAATLSSSASPAPFTVFAPLNSSFQALIDESTTDGLNSIQDILALPNLATILTYHVVGGAAVRQEDITNGQVVNPIAMGTSFTINTTSGVNITDGQARVTPILVTNVTGINGVVHAIGRVLLP